MHTFEFHKLVVVLLAQLHLFVILAHQVLVLLRHIVNRMQHLPDTKQSVSLQSFLSIEEQDYSSAVQNHKDLLLQTELFSALSFSPFPLLSFPHNQ